MTRWTSAALQMSQGAFHIMTNRQSSQVMTSLWLEFKCWFFEAIWVCSALCWMIPPIMRGKKRSLFALIQVQFFNKQQRADGQEQNALLLWVSYAAWHMEHASHTSAGKHKACLKGKGKAPVTLQGATCDWNGVGSVFPHWLLEVQGSSTIYTYRFHKGNIHTYIYTYIYIYIYIYIHTYIHIHW